MLREAVIKQAIVDYQRALKFNDTQQISKLERFFLSGDFEIWCNLDGKYIVDSVRKKVEDGRRKKI